MTPPESPTSRASTPASGDNFRALFIKLLHQGFFALGIDLVFTEQFLCRNHAKVGRTFVRFGNVTRGDAGLGIDQVHVPTRKLGGQLPVRFHALGKVNDDGSNRGEHRRERTLLRMELFSGLVVAVRCRHGPTTGVTISLAVPAGRGREKDRSVDLPGDVRTGFTIQARGQTVNRKGGFSPSPLAF